MKLPIKVGYCIAYDWYFLATSLPLIYPYADEICLALDKDRVSWTGKKYDFDEVGFSHLVKKIDTANKITIYEDDFHKPQLAPMENEVRQRNLMANKLGKGNSWHIQLDADEYFINFKGFIDFLHNFKPSRPVNINCLMYTLFKVDKNGYLFIRPKTDENIEFIQIATNVPEYQFGRKNGHFNIKTNFGLIHQSWARSEDEILQKINNWGHKNDFDVMAYFERWKDLNSNNYRDFKNFHPINPEVWYELELVKADNIGHLIKKLSEKPLISASSNYLIKENSIWISRLKAVWKRIKR